MTYRGLGTPLIQAGTGDDAKNGRVTMNGTGPLYPPRSEVTIDEEALQGAPGDLTEGEKKWSCNYCSDQRCH